jgi:hypothetical protein
MDVSRMDREKWRQEINANCPHHVDLTPPGDGYGEAVRAQIMDFLESRIGSFRDRSRMKSTARAFGNRTIKS